MITLSWKDFAILSNILLFAFDDNITLESSTGTMKYFSSEMIKWKIGIGKINYMFQI
jgi:hypothetical protein